MRYAPASRLAYSDQVAVPQLVSDFGAKLRLIAQHATDRATALKLGLAKKGLANEHKRSVGKRVMMQKLRLEAERRAEEEALCAARPEAAPLLGRLAEVYATLREGATLSEALDGMRGVYHGSTLLAVGHAVHEAAVEAAKPDGERETAYRARNLPFLVKRLAKRLSDLHPPHEAALLRRACSTAAKLPLGLLPDHLAALEATAVALEGGAAALPALATLAADDLEKLLSGGGDLVQPLLAGEGGEGGKGDGGAAEAVCRRDAAVAAAAAVLLLLLAAAAAAASGSAAGSLRLRARAWSSSCRSRSLSS
mmetsp:Transcript_28615/g.84416  ORF Transcript_28615/g.84416 Transcript_28615/m.84416 type:complete len:309 (-) Transcript_28615:366-1292(-)